MVRDLQDIILAPGWTQSFCTRRPRTSPPGPPYRLQNTKRPERYADGSVRAAVHVVLNTGR
jgi:hypothetical protein